MLVPFAALVFFGMVVDQVYHIWRDLFFGADIVLGGLEDGGEMISITVALLLAAAIFLRGPGQEFIYFRF